MSCCCSYIVDTWNPCSCECGCASTTSTSTTTTTTCAGQPCDVVMDPNCIIYNGPDIPCYGIQTGDTAADILQIIINNFACITTTTAARSFTLASTEFTTFGYIGGVTPNGTLGWTGPGTDNVGLEGYVADDFVGSKATDIQTFFTDNGLLIDSTAYIFNVTWGAGSSIASGKVMLGFDNSFQRLFISAVYTGNNNWQTPGQNISSGGPMATAGTFNFPATFSLYTPTIANSTSWC